LRPELDDESLQRELRVFQRMNAVYQHYTKLRLLARRCVVRCIRAAINSVGR
jgi:hypothetical protein